MFFVCINKTHRLDLNQAGIVAAPYHAGLKDGERKRIQQDWTKGDIQVASK